MGIEKQFPTGPVVRTHASTARGTGLSSGWKTKIPHAAEPKNKLKVKKLILKSKKKKKVETTI